MNLTSVETEFLQRSKRTACVYPGEKAPVVEVLNVYELGKIVALSFLEWVCDNPNGVVALPTGKTPEYFIKTMEKYQSTWNNPQTQAEIRGYDYKGDRFPSTEGLKFVMLDEFFPMLPTHRNSFCNYVRHFYLTTLGIKEENVIDFDLLKNNVLLEAELSFFEDRSVDLSLLTRDPKTSEEDTAKSILYRVQQFCKSVEERIATWGGIGFFLGGIGPDGHIAFNQEGADHASTTR